MNKLLPLLACLLITVNGCAININGSNRRSTPRFTYQHVYLTLVVIVGGAYLINAISKN
jgi:hypothetical protein